MPNLVMQASCESNGCRLGRVLTNGAGQVFVAQAVATRFGVAEAFVWCGVWVWLCVCGRLPPLCYSTPLRPCNPGPGSLPGNGATVCQLLVCCYLVPYYLGAYLMCSSLLIACMGALVVLLYGAMVLLSVSRHSQQSAARAPYVWPNIMVFCISMSYGLLPLLLFLFGCLIHVHMGMVVVAASPRG